MKDKPWFAMCATRKVQVLWVQGEEWGRSKEEGEKVNKQPLQHLHQQGGQEGLHTLSLEEEEKWQGGGHQGEQASQQWGQTLLGAKANHFKYEEHQESLDPEREVRSPCGRQGIWRLDKVWMHFMGCIMMDKIIAKWVSEYYGPKFPFPC